MSKSQKKELLSIIIGAILLAAAVTVTKTVLKGPTWAVLLIFLVPYLWLGYKVLFDAVHGLVSGSFMDENFLMAVASIGALCIGEHTEAVLVMLLYCIGEFLEELAIGRSRSSIAALTDIRPDRANLEKDGEIIETDCENVHIGDIILVRAGERIPLDGIVIEGSSGLNTSALTGESLPRDVTVGDEVLSGCINISGTLRIRIVKEACDSTASRILELIEGASANKSKSEGFITKFAKWYTPAIIAIVILLAVIPPLFFNQSWSEWVYNALNILVISCPCALVISVPLTFFGGIGAASRKGILVKGSNYLETLSKCSTMVFDKTGTLTKGTFKIKRINAVGVSEE
ncbi:MAG: HAD-IC family P-type ATPase, partial [Clostridiales bacterium]|nr:HAD-IC family P-type ATPase [Clostridiales bacterium]